MSNIRKAVFPVAGLGTRFLPATKATPKEMLPIVDKPLIQYAVEEALEAGIEQMIFVTGRGKSALEDHFDMAFELETTMRSRGKTMDLVEGTRLAPGAITYVRQQEPLGLGHAVWCARHIIGDEPFAVILPDDFMVGEPGCLAQMVAAHARVGGNIICAEEVDPARTGSYGILSPGTRDGALTEVLGMVEKPAPAEAPSNLAIVGRYILQPSVMAALADHQRGSGGEIQLTDAMAKVMRDEAFHGYTFRGRRYDCGDKAGYVEATMAMALARPDLAPTVRQFAASLAEIRAAA